MSMLGYSYMVGGFIYLYVVRQWDGKVWNDITYPSYRSTAVAKWNELTENGTKHVDNKAGMYYDVFEARTFMEKRNPLPDLEKEVERLTRERNALAEVVGKAQMAEIMSDQEYIERLQAEEIRLTEEVDRIGVELRYAKDILEYAIAQSNDLYDDNVRLERELEESRRTVAVLNKSVDDTLSHFQAREGHNERVLEQVSELGKRMQSLREELSAARSAAVVWRDAEINPPTESAEYLTDLGLIFYNFWENLWYYEDGGVQVCHPRTWSEVPAPPEELGKTQYDDGSQDPEFDHHLKCTVKPSDLRLILDTLNARLGDEPVADFFYRAYHRLRDSLPPKER